MKKITVYVTQYWWSITYMPSLTNTVDSIIWHYFVEWSAFVNSFFAALEIKRYHNSAKADGCLIVVGVRKLVMKRNTVSTWVDKICLFTITIGPLDSACISEKRRNLDKSKPSDAILKGLTMSSRSWSLQALTVGLLDEGNRLPRANVFENSTWLWCPNK